MQRSEEDGIMDAVVDAGQWLDWRWWAFGKAFPLRLQSQRSRRKHCAHDIGQGGDAYLPY